MQRACGRWPGAARSVRLVIHTVCCLLFALALVGCGFTAEPQPLLLGEAPWQSGERSVYQVTNRQEQVVGNAIMKVEQAGDADSWLFTRQINDIDITERVTVAVKMPGYIPVVSTLTRNSSAGTQRVQANYDKAKVEIELNNRQGLLSYETVNVTSDVRDDRTIVPLLRTLPLQNGYATFINSFLPITGQQERLAIQVVKDETVTVPAGTFDSWQVELKTTDRTSRVWIAKTEPHPVVKFVDGRSQATFELSEFDPVGSE